MFTLIQLLNVYVLYCYKMHVYFYLLKWACKTQNSRKFEVSGVEDSVLV